MLNQFSKQFISADQNHPKVKVLPHGNLVCKIPLIWRMLTRMTRSHCAGAAGGGQSCDPSLGAALCLHFLQTETHHSPPSPTSSPPSPKIQPLKKEFVHRSQPPSLPPPSPSPLPKIPRFSKNIGVDVKPFCPFCPFCNRLEKKL